MKRSNAKVQRVEFVKTPKPKFQQERRERPAYKFQAKTPRQEELVENLFRYSLVLALGPAGTGKTYVSGMVAARALLDGSHNKIILSRPNVPTGRTLGHFPGNIAEKMSPWLAPMMNVLRQALGSEDYEARFGKSIQIQPLETIRGCSFDDAFILIDESQNLTLEEIKALTTRIGENSTLVLMGDPNQSDVTNGNDLLRFADLCNRSGIEVPVTLFGISDIVRSDIVGKLVRMFYEQDL